MAHKEHKVTHGHSDTGDVQVADRGKKAKCGATWSPRAWGQVRALSRDRSLVTPTQLPEKKETCCRPPAFVTIEELKDVYLEEHICQLPGPE